ncbi:MAG: hypothetical protein IKZ82_05830 [Clostridia bacterium]|nr:hypothetical protein [Clostridia bacterium]
MMDKFGYDEDKYNKTAQAIPLPGVKLKLIVYTEKHFAQLKAKRFMITDESGVETKQNLWIPNRYLLPDGSIDFRHDLTWLFNTPPNRRNIRLAIKEIEERCKNG